MRVSKEQISDWRDSLQALCDGGMSQHHAASLTPEEVVNIIDDYEDQLQMNEALSEVMRSHTVTTRDLRDRLREALSVIEFYADGKNYKESEHPSCVDRDIDLDDGDRARAFLEKDAKYA